MPCGGGRDAQDGNGKGEDVSGPGDEPWAKLRHDDSGAVVAALPLVDHALDVGAAFAALLAGGAWAGALAAAAGRPLTSLDHARLTVLAALHDIGKANAGFQARARPGAAPVGHEPQVAALLKAERLRGSAAGQALLAVQRDWGAAGLMPALFAHHGRPREAFAGPPPTGGRNLAWQAHEKHWRPRDGYDPVAAAAAVIARVRARHEGAWEDGPTLPDAPRFAALFAGLVTLADWLGSDERRFPVDGPHGQARDALRREQAAAAVRGRGLAPLETPAAGFPAAFGFDPRGVQGEAAADGLGAVALIEAETGSGKTEAALWRWLALRRRGAVDGLFFALPTRTAAVQLHRRVQRMLDRVWGDGAPEAVLAVPGYLRAGDAEGQALPGWRVRWDDRGDDARWAAERADRFLAARVAVGTIDQALLASLPVRHAFVRAAALARSLLVVDEVHASDAYTGGLLAALLANHVGAGGQALLLSATLGGTARARLLGGAAPTLAEAETAAYPALSGSAASLRAVAADGAPAKRVRIEIAGLIDDPAAIAAAAVAAARAGASVLVVRNTVAGAVAAARAVEALAPEFAFTVGGVQTLHHGRFAASDRRLLDDAVETAFGRGRSAEGRVLVGTQTLEQSLDIDADLLLTDIAPIDVLLQRIGRLHRHPRGDRGAFAAARAVVLRPAERDLTPLLGRRMHGLGPDRAYPDLLQIEATLRVLEAHGAVTIPADNRRLVERALHPEAIEALAAELGTAWQNHRAGRSGRDVADRQQAADLALSFDTPFRDIVFPSDEAPIATRLGARDLLVDLEGAPAGPFGAPVSRIAIPRWMAPDATADDTVAMLPAAPGEVRFRLGGRAFAYDRWGLA
jgi:CRISPR-associated endonuclease/helicase Cas3